MSGKVKLWLSTEALKNNPKIDARETGHVTQEYGAQYTYLFKPPYNIKNKKMLVRLLQVSISINPVIGIFSLIYIICTVSKPNFKNF